MIRFRSSINLAMTIAAASTLWVSAVASADPRPSPRRSSRPPAAHGGDTIGSLAREAAVEAPGRAARGLGRLIRRGALRARGAASRPVGRAESASALVRVLVESAQERSERARSFSDPGGLRRAADAWIKVAEAAQEAESAWRDVNRVNDYVSAADDQVHAYEAAADLMADAAELYGDFGAPSAADGAREERARIRSADYLEKAGDVSARTPARQERAVQHYAAAAAHRVALSGLRLLYSGNPAELRRQLATDALRLYDRALELGPTAEIRQARAQAAALLVQQH